MAETAFRRVLVRVATDPEFAEAVRRDQEMLTSQFGLTPAEAAVVVAALLGTDGEPQG